MTRKKIIVANWKMNSSFDESDQWLVSFIEHFEAVDEGLKNVEAIVCPAVTLLDNMSASIMDYSFERLEEKIVEQNKEVEDFEEEVLSEMILSGRPISLGAQDCHYEDSGAFTGDVSAKMLVEVGAQYVILGHSERRERHFESSEIVAKKVAVCSLQKITPILCVGENKEMRDSAKHLEFVYRQLLSSVPKGVRFEKLIIAYEPIWSIGTGIVPSIMQIKEMVSLIKKIAKEKISEVADEFFVLYGGSVSLENAGEILSISNLDGLLIGKVSLDVDNFFEICKKASI